MAKEVTLNNRLNLLNRQPSVMLVMVEPLGEDFWILPGQKLELRYVGSNIEVVWGNDMFGVESGSHCVAVYPPDCCDWAFFEGDEQVYCGHERPDGWGEELQQKYREVLKHIGSDESQDAESTIVNPQDNS